MYFLLFLSAKVICDPELSDYNSERSLLSELVV